MKSNIFIPKTINVGYQNRSGTYTGKLAYVIYYDEKGKLRKEASWNSWRDEKIPNEEFENIPTEGFVLNKKVGDYSNGWDHRQAYCRVYDPRNFEFEITIENLLYILENANSIKGKGLEGEFVYGWDGKDLILMPVESPDYMQIKEYNEIVHNNEHIKAKDLIVGATYLTKNNEEYIYMGKYDYYSYGYQWIEDGEKKTSIYSSDIPYKKDPSYSVYREKIDYEYIDYPYGKYHWFATKYYDHGYVDRKYIKKETYKWGFVQLKSIPKGKLIKCINEKCNNEYSDIYISMTHSNEFSPRNYEKTKYVPYLFDEFCEYVNNYTEFISMPESHNINVNYLEIYRVSKYEKGNNLWCVNVGYKTDDSKLFARFRYNQNKIESHDRWNKSRIQKTIIPIDIRELYDRLKPCYQEIYLENGNLYERKYYYGDKK